MVAEEVKTIALTADRLINSIDPEPINNATILIKGNKITGVGGNNIIPPNAKVIELQNTTLMPGLIDTHCHPMSSLTDEYQTEHLRYSSAYKALRGLKTVTRQLEAGWTSLRGAGELDVAYGVIDLKNALLKKMFKGPNLCGAAHYISVTGGGGDIAYLSHEQPIIPDGLIVNSEQEMQKTVRNEIKRGSDWIKLLVSGAFMTAHDNPEDSHMTYDEIAMAVSTAKQFSIPVMAHAHGAKAIRDSIKAGVRSIEHGTFVDEAGIDLMVKNGTYLVPTLYIGDHFIENEANNPAAEKMVNLSKKYRDRYFSCIGAAMRAGVRITVGVDFGDEDPHLSTRELSCLVEAGYSPMEAIIAATRTGAELLSWDQKLGSIAVGKVADIIAVPGNPLKDLSLMEKVSFVMKSGDVIKHPTDISI